MGAVAAGAIGDDLRSEAGGESVIAREVGSGAASLNTEFLREANAFMAAGASDLRNILRGYGRVRIGVRLNGVDAVAIGANRSLPVALRDGGSVNALLKLF